MVIEWDPEWLEFEKSMGEAPSLPEDMKAKKTLVEGLLMASAERLPPPPDNIIAKDLQIPDGPIVRAYKPTGHDGLLPLVLFCHGGGWFAGNLDTEDRTCRMVCSMMPAWVVSVDYRCDIDVPLELQVDDCHAAFEWALSRTATHGIDPKKLVVWGGSCGGTLATAVVYRLVQSGKGHHVAGLFCMNSVQLHPGATPEKYKHLHTSYFDNAGFLPFISGHDTLQLFKQRDIEPPNTDVNVFPTAGGAEALKGFPPTYIITSDNDASRDDGTVFEAVLKDADVKVKRDNIKGLAHYFWVFDLPKANNDFWARICGGIRWTLSQ